MTDKKSWTEKMRDIDPDAFAEAKDAAAEIPLTMFHLTDLIARNEDLRKKYEELAGKTTSRGGMFAMADYIEPAMVGSGEAIWFQQAAKFCRQVMNVIAGKPLEDMSDFTTEEMRRATRGPYTREFLDLGHKYEAITSVFPSEGRGQGSA